MQARRNCKIKTYSKASAEDIVEQEDNQADFYLGQVLPDTSNIPNCPECNSDQVAGIFHGSVPSSNGPKPSGRLLELIESQKVVMYYTALAASWPAESRPMWHCHECGRNFR